MINELHLFSTFLLLQALKCDLASLTGDTTPEGAGPDRGTLWLPDDRFTSYTTTTSDYDTVHAYMNMHTVYTHKNRQ